MVLLVVAAVIDRLVDVFNRLACVGMRGVFEEKLEEVEEGEEVEARALVELKSPPELKMIAAKALSVVDCSTGEVVVRGMEPRLCRGCENGMSLERLEVKVPG